MGRARDLARSWIRNNPTRWKSVLGFSKQRGWGNNWARALRYRPCPAIRTCKRDRRGESILRMPTFAINVTWSRRKLRRRRPAAFCSNKWYGRRYAGALSTLCRNGKWLFASFAASDWEITVCGAPTGEGVETGVVRNRREVLLAPVAISPIFVIWTWYSGAPDSWGSSPIKLRENAKLLWSAISIGLIWEIHWW